MNTHTEKPTPDVIVKAFKKHHGGHENTDPREIVRLFRELPAETQERYLTAVKTTKPQKESEATSADNLRPNTNV
jgi:sulfur relay (sulfurtransferase) DsrC/TusE family protein